jgi:hypothetical protein
LFFDRSYKNNTAMSYGGGYGSRNGGSNGYSNGYDSTSGGGYGAANNQYDYYNQYASYGYENIPTDQAISGVVLAASSIVLSLFHPLLRTGLAHRSGWDLIFKVSGPLVRSASATFLHA